MTDFASSGSELASASVAFAAFVVSAEGSSTASAEGSAGTAGAGLRS